MSTQGTHGEQGTDVKGEGIQPVEGERGAGGAQRPRPVPRETRLWKVQAEPGNPARADWEIHCRDIYDSWSEEGILCEAWGEENADRIMQALAEVAVSGWVAR